MVAATTYAAVNVPIQELRWSNKSIFAYLARKHYVTEYSLVLAITAPPLRYCIKRLINSLAESVDIKWPDQSDQQWFIY